VRIRKFCNSPGPSCHFKNTPNPDPPETTFRFSFSPFPIRPGPQQGRREGVFPVFSVSRAEWRPLPVWALVGPSLSIPLLLACFRGRSGPTVPFGRAEGAPARGPRLSLFFLLGSIRAPFLTGPGAACSFFLSLNGIRWRFCLFFWSDRARGGLNFFFCFFFFAGREGRVKPLDPFPEEVGVAPDSPTLTKDASPRSPFPPLFQRSCAEARVP